MKSYQHSTACAVFDDEDERGCTCQDNPIPSHPETEDALVPAQASSVSSLYQDRFYESLEFMSAAAIEAAFSGEHGELRESPDAFHREVDGTLSGSHRAERDEVSQ